MFVKGCLIFSCLLKFRISVTGHSKHIYTTSNHKTHHTLTPTIMLSLTYPLSPNTPPPPHFPDVLLNHLSLQRPPISRLFACPLSELCWRWSQGQELLQLAGQRQAGYHSLHGRVLPPPGLHQQLADHLAATPHQALGLLRELRQHVQDPFLPGVSAQHLAQNFERAHLGVRHGIPTVQVQPHVVQCGVAAQGVKKGLGAVFTPVCLASQLLGAAAGAKEQRHHVMITMAQGMVHRCVQIKVHPVKVTAR